MTVCDESSKETLTWIQVFVFSLMTIVSNSFKINKLKNDI